MVGPSRSRPPMSHRKTDLGIPRPSKSAKVVLIGLSTRTPRSIALFSASAPLHHSLSSADFITNIAESSFRHTHPIDSSIDPHQIESMRRSSVRQKRCAHTTKNRMEVLCPRVTQAAMIAAASFGLRRSGTFCDGNIGSGLLGRISEAWPALAPPGECS